MCLVLLRPRPRLKTRIIRRNMFKGNGNKIKFSKDNEVLFRPLYTDAMLNSSFRTWRSIPSFPSSEPQPIAYFASTRSAVMLNSYPLQNVS